MPELVDPVDPMVVYGDLPVARGRPAVRLNMIASVDGATTVAGLSGGLGGPADKRVFSVLRSLADAVLVAAGTVRAETYGPSPHLIAVVSRSCVLDWRAPFFIEAPVRPIVITVAAAQADDRARAAEVADVGERQRPDHVPGHEPRAGDEQGERGPACGAHPVAAPRRPPEQPQHHGREAGQCQDADPIDRHPCHPGDGGRRAVVARQ